MHYKPRTLKKSLTKGRASKTELRLAQKRTEAGGQVMSLSGYPPPMVTFPQGEG